MIGVYAVCAIAAVAGAVGVVWARQPVHQVLALVLNFFALAVLYLSQDAEFVAVIQMIVYAGAIMVLFLFVVALLSAKRDTTEKRVVRFGLWEGAAAILTLGVFGALIAAVRGVHTGAAAPAPEGFGTTAAFGQALLRTHVFPFELTAFVLMVAVIGVIILVGRKQA